MADEFEAFLAAVLAPPERAEDRQFVAAVQARIAFEDQLAFERRAIARNFFQQFFALFSVTGAVWWLGRAAPIADWYSSRPGLGLAVILAAFACVVALLTASSTSPAVSCR